jgi:hypothetical protein
MLTCACGTATAVMPEHVLRATTLGGLDRPSADLGLGLEDLGLGFEDLLQVRDPHARLRLQCLRCCPPRPTRW